MIPLKETKLLLLVKITNKKIKMEKEKYFYHIEDGQFSFEQKTDYLAGKVGDTVKIYTDRYEDFEEVLIVNINGNYIDCIAKEKTD